MLYAPLNIKIYVPVFYPASYRIVSALLLFRNSTIVSYIFGA